MKVDVDAFFGYRWHLELKPLEQKVAELEDEGYVADWLSDDIVNLLSPPEGGS